MNQTVSQLVLSIKDILDTQPDLQNVTVQGEISNFIRYRSGHWYFSLKDKTAKINCVMFAGSNRRVQFDPKDGDQVIITGNVSVYQASGQLQLIIATMQAFGQGDLHARYLELRDKLHKEGYFDQKYKKELVRYPLKIGVISGQSSAALADILKTLQHRWPLAQVKVYPSLVQGASAPAELITKIQLADQDELDVILLARGGGSLEDLWAFNDENLVKTIFQAKTPIVTGVGHEIDITLVDYVADVRAVTPTAAAQVATPDQYEVYQILDTYEVHLNQILRQKLRNASNQLNYLVNSSYLKNPSQFFLTRELELKEIDNKLKNYFDNVTQQRQKVLHMQTEIIHKSNTFIRDFKEILYRMTERITNHQNNLYNRKQHEFSLLVSKLNALSPLAIMSKGYLLSYQEGRLVHSVSDINSFKTIKLRYHDGRIIVKKVENVNDN